MDPPGQATPLVAAQNNALLFPGSVVLAYNVTGVCNSLVCQWIAR
jgi:hypothetical protein